MDLGSLRQRQSLPLKLKVLLTKSRIRNWYETHDGDVSVSFSGGLDSNVLQHIVREMYPDVLLMFSDTGLEYPEIRSFVKTFDNVKWVRPEKSFKWVIENKGYPVVSKLISRCLKDMQNPTPNNVAVRNLHMTGMTRAGVMCKSKMLSHKWRFLIDAPFKVSDACCDYLKKSPAKKFHKESGLAPILGTLAEESQMRERQYIKYGCNAFEQNYSAPLSFWTHQDILTYTKQNNLPYCSVYGDIVCSDGKLCTTREKRTGCMFCMFGVHMEKEPNRFQRMAIYHPNQYKFCIENLGLGKVLDYIKVPYKNEQSKLEV